MSLLRRLREALRRFRAESSRIDEELRRRGIDPELLPFLFPPYM